MPLKNLKKPTNQEAIFPKKMRFLSDETEVELQDVSQYNYGIKTDKIFGKYVYTKSRTKLGMELYLSEEELPN